MLLESTSKKYKSLKANHLDLLDMLIPQGRTSLVGRERGWQARGPPMFMAYIYIFFMQGSPFLTYIPS